MRNLFVKMLFPVAIAGIFTGCNQEVTVEDGAVLNATVKDSANLIGLAQNSGNLYKFERSIRYPVYARGGFIDINEDGIYNVDVESKLQFEMKAKKGKVITAITTLIANMSNRDINSLKNDLNINDLYLLPSEDKNIYVLNELIVKEFINLGRTNLTSNEINEIKLAYKSYDFKTDSDLSTSEYAKKKEAILIASLRAEGKIKEELDFDVANKIPTANAGSDIIANFGESISFDASSSIDYDGTIVSYKWSKNGVLVSASESFYKDDLEVGEHTISLLVEDDNGAKSSDNINVLINKVNEFPIANAGVDVTISEGESVTFDGSLSKDVDGEIVSYNWTLDGTLISTLASFTKNDFEVGVHTLTLEVTDNEGAISTDEMTLTVKEVDVEAGVTRIHEIQGNSSISPLKNQTVKVRAIVVADFQNSDELKGFYIQEEDNHVDENENTSEGIFVYHSSDDVKIGDLVELTGVVDEYYDLTQIKNVSTLKVVSSNNDLPTASVVSLPMTSSTEFEKYEGMYVKFEQKLVVSALYQLRRYGQITLSSKRLWQGTQIAMPGAESQTVTKANLLDQIKLDDASTRQNPSVIKYPSPGLSKTNIVRGGDSITNLTGVITYSFGSYMIITNNEVNFVQDNPRPQVPTINGNFKIASINVLNYFRTIDDGSNTCAGLNQGCRGADSSEELQRQTQKMKVALEKMDADIIGLMEIQNDGGVTAKYIADLLEGYDYVKNPQGEKSLLGTDVITTAFIYKKDSVELVGDSKTIANGQYQGAFDNRNRKPIAQTFKHKVSNEVFTVINNHFKSKGSGCGANDDSSLQGNCNGTRTKASQDILSWIDDLKVQVSDNDFLIIGDLNAYAKEDPIVTLENGGFKNLDKADAYSYTYDAQLGTLDYVLANESMNSKVVTSKHWHINSDETDIFDYNKDSTYKNYGKLKPENFLSEIYEANEFRMSDHDPVIVGFNFVVQNSAPIANAGDDLVVESGNSVTFDASKSLDNDGEIVSYKWILNDEVLYEGINSTFVKNDFEDGVYNISLEVKDSEGAIGTDSINLIVGELPNVTPIANAGLDIEANLGEDVVLNGTLSSDEDGEIVNYKWIKEDEVLYTGTNSTFVKNDFEVGVHTITLEVTDNQGSKSSDTVIVKVLEVSQGNDAIFISEYVEGGGNNKAIEIFNGTSNPIDISNYKLVRYSNGSSKGVNISLESMTIESGEVFVIVNPSSTDDFRNRANQLSGNISHNGDDAYELVNISSNAIVDTFGQIGTDPGSAWSANGVSTKDKTLRRKDNISLGDTNGTDTFDPSLQWDVFTKDTFNGLGSR